MGESLLQIQLLIALRNFVVALGDQSPISYNILLPILQKGIDINNPDELNLLEDSMQVGTYLIFIGGKIVISIQISCLWHLKQTCSYGKPQFIMHHLWYPSCCHTFHAYWK